MSTPSGGEWGLDTDRAFGTRFRVWIGRCDDAARFSLLWASDDTRAGQASSLHTAHSSKAVPPLVGVGVADVELRCLLLLAPRHQAGIRVQHPFHRPWVL